MKGLLRNNFFAVWANAKVFSVFMFVWGIVVVIIPAETFQMWYIMIGIVGFSVNAASGTGNEFTSRWGKYKLLVITLLCASGIVSLLFNVTNAAPLPGIALSLCCSILFFALSYPLTVSIYRKKEY